MLGLAECACSPPISTATGSDLLTGGFKSVSILLSKGDGTFNGAVACTVRHDPSYVIAANL